MSRSNNPPEDNSDESNEQSDARSLEDRIAEWLDPDLMRPLDSAADAGRSNRSRIQFDPHISDVLVEHARGRAPDESSHPDQDFRNHLMGIASEVATATWRQGEIDKRILPDYATDGGVDVRAPSPRGGETNQYQVKSTRDIWNPERVVSQDELEKADYFVLCCTDAPSNYVEIVGYISRPLLRLLGEAYRRDGYLLSPENLFPVKPEWYGPDDVRDVMYG